MYSLPEKKLMAKTISRRAPFSSCSGASFCIIESSYEADQTSLNQQLPSGLYQSVYSSWFDEDYNSFFCYHYVKLKYVHILIDMEHWTFYFTCT